MWLVDRSKTLKMYMTLIVTDYMLKILIYLPRVAYDVLIWSVATLSIISNYES